MATGGLGAAAMAFGVRSILKGNAVLGGLLAALGAALGLRAATGKSIAYRTLSRHRLLPFG